MGAYNIQERLDRYLANKYWLDKFSFHTVHHLAHMQSDHCPLLLNWDSKNPTPPRRRGKKPFRFEAMWLQDSSCLTLVDDLWRSIQIDQSPTQFS